MNTKTLMKKADLPSLKPARQGKVRDIFDFGDTLLIVATDRISAFDVVMNDPIPDKGRVLTRISEFWFGATETIIANHLISTSAGAFPESCQPYRDTLEGRSMWVRKAEPLPVECIVRGYLAGSGLKDYRRTGAVCGHKLPAGLLESSRLPQPIFTPSTKAEGGAHDINISFDQMADIIGTDLAQNARATSLALYQKGCEIAEQRGIIIADTKFEFGLIDDELVLIDKVLTPDSSRFWPKDHYQPGKPQTSFDKQFLRDYLESLDWDKTPPPPELSKEVINKTAGKYREALERITSKKFKQEGP